MGVRIAWTDAQQPQWCETGVHPSSGQPSSWSTCPALSACAVLASTQLVQRLADALDECGVHAKHKQKGQQLLEEPGHVEGA
jgi:hypothetical protein